MASRPGHRGAYRCFGAHRLPRPSSSRWRRAVADPELGRATERGRYQRRRADGECRGERPADARGPGDRRRLPRCDPRQRPAQRTNAATGLFRRAQGDRVSDGLGADRAEPRRGARRARPQGILGARVDRKLHRAVEAVRPLNAFITETPEQALAMAKAADERLARGEGRAARRHPGRGQGPVIAPRGCLTTAGSHILDGFRPPYESTVTEKLWQAGAVMLGKTNLDEFAMGSSNTTSYYGPVENPWRRTARAAIQATTGHWCRAAPRAARRRRWRRRRPWRRPAPIPGVRSASRRAFAGSSG